MTDLVPYGEDSSFALLRMDAADARELLQDALGGESLGIGDLDRVKVPSGGGTTWEIPTLDGEVATKEIEAVIIHAQTRRAYWPYSMEDRPDDDDGKPHCQSQNGEVGVGEPGGECITCPLNQFGTDIKGGPGKACKETRQLFLLMKDDLLPITLNVPPASLKSLKEYRLKLTRGQVPLSALVTKLSLERVTTGKTPFARINFVGGPRLDPQARERVREYTAMLMPAMQAVAVDYDQD